MPGPSDATWGDPGPLSAVLVRLGSRYRTVRLTPSPPRPSSGSRRDRMMRHPALGAGRGAAIRKIRAERLQPPLATTDIACPLQRSARLPRVTPLRVLLSTFVACHSLRWPTWSVNSGPSCRSVRFTIENFTCRP